MKSIYLLVLTAFAFACSGEIADSDPDTATLEEAAFWDDFTSVPSPPNGYLVPRLPGDSEFLMTINCSHTSQAGRDACFRVLNARCKDSGGAGLRTRLEAPHGTGTRIAGLCVVRAEVE